MNPLDSAIVSSSDRERPLTLSFRRFALALAAFIVLPPLSLAAFVLLVDPYYVFGSPSVPGINVVRPFYELHVLAAKPYQVQRIKPAAVTLGSSRVEVGLDPRHAGWADRNVFNFGLPSASSYEVMLAFLHAGAVGQPLKQAVVGLDFFGFNMFFPRNREQLEARFAGSGSEAFADFLATELANRPRDDKAAMPADPRVTEPVRRTHAPVQPAAETPEPEAWSEAVYLAIHPDVAAAVARKDFKSGREHYELAGRAEGRETGMSPNDWSEALYLSIYPDVAAEVRRGTFASGYHHYLVAGRAEGRDSGVPPSAWNEAQYLSIYPDVAAEVRRGTFVSGYHHYLVAGRAEGRDSGVPPSAWNEAQYLSIYPDVAAEVRRGTFVSGYHHYLVAGRAEGRESGVPPSDWNEALYLRLHPDVAAEVRRGTFQNGYHHYLVAGRAEGRKDGRTPSEWNETLYLRVNPDVQREVNRGTFLNGYHHYLVIGRSENREGGMVPRDWDEAAYLQINQDVEYQISQGFFLSGYHHYLVAGRAEKRLSGNRPAGWDEAQYLATNPAARTRIALGEYKTGYAHYAAVGREQGLLGGLPPADPVERLRLHWPELNRVVFQLGERFRMIFSTTVVRDSIATVFRQSEPASFDDRGVRIWSGQGEEITRRSGGTGRAFRANFLSWRWYLWLPPPRFMYCFTNAETGATTFDPYRFMLRRAYSEGTDLRLYVTPLNASVRKLMVELGLGEHYEFWLKELVRINEEEAARAARKPLPLWDFSDVNTITGEAVPLPTDPNPMRWSWDFSHYRMAAGDLILDRVLDHGEAGRDLPADFGVRLTGENVAAHVARNETTLADWTAANTELASQIVAATRSPRAQNRQAEAACW